MLVNRCPNLVDLQILQYLDNEDDLPEEYMQQMFWNARWPHLERLTVESSHIPGEIAERFFKCHPLLRHLCIRGINGMFRKIVIDNLPNLRYLGLGWFPEPKNISVATISHLEGLKLPLNDVNRQKVGDLERILSPITHLRCLILCDVYYSSEYLMAIARLAPKVEKLALQWVNHDGYLYQAGQAEGKVCLFFPLKSNTVTDGSNF